MLEKAYVFERPNGAVGIMLLAQNAELMLERVSAAGWCGTIDWWSTEFTVNGGPPELPAVINLSRERKFFDVVRFVNRVEKRGLGQC